MHDRFDTSIHPEISHSDLDAPGASHSCSEHFVPIQRKGKRIISGVELVVDEELYRCSVCGEEEYSYEQAEAAQRQASALYRAQFRLLAPEEILSIRSQLGVSQDYLERALGLGAKTFSRWESGRVLQTRAMDNLLRLLALQPSLLAFLAEHNGVEVSPDLAQSKEAAPAVARDCAIRIPFSLERRLSEEAKSENASLDAYATMLLSIQVERRSVDHSLQNVNQRLGALSQQLAVWSKPVAEEPWMREHYAIHTPYAQAG